MRLDKGWVEHGSWACVNTVLNEIFGQLMMTASDEEKTGDIHCSSQVVPVMRLHLSLLQKTTLLRNCSLSIPL